MPVTLTDPSQLLLRHQLRFSAVLQEAQRLTADAAHDQFSEVVDQFSGPPSQPSGDSRREWERSERPFAKYFFDRPNHSPANPNPVGVITGELLNSLSYNMDSVGAIFTAYSFSSGVDYVKFLLTVGGTEYMVDRGVTQHMAAWTIMRVQRLGADIMTYQRSLL